MRETKAHEYVISDELHIIEDNGGLLDEFTQAHMVTLGGKQIRMKNGRGELKDDSKIKIRCSTFQAKATDELKASK